MSNNVETFTKGQTVVKEKKSRKVANLRRRVSKTELIFPEGQLYAFKVVKRMGNGLLHSGSVPLGSKLHKTYQEHQKTSVSEEMYNAGYGICVFETFKQASNWNGNNDGTTEIWKVACGPLKTPAATRPSISELDSLLPKNDAKVKKMNYRKVLHLVQERQTRNSWPVGAMVTEWVVLVEKVS